MPAMNARGSLSAAALATIGASLCCVAPLAPLALGIGGAWVVNLTALEPYRPIFVGLTLLFLGLAFCRLYLLPRACPADPAAALLHSHRGPRDRRHRDSRSGERYRVACNTVRTDSTEN